MNLYWLHIEIDDRHRLDLVAHYNAGQAQDLYCAVHPEYADAIRQVEFVCHTERPEAPDVFASIHLGTLPPEVRPDPRADEP